MFYWIFSDSAQMVVKWVVLSSTSIWIYHLHPIWIVDKKDFFLSADIIKRNSFSTSFSGRPYLLSVARYPKFKLQCANSCPCMHVLNKP